VEKKMKKVLTSSLVAKDTKHHVRKNKMHKFEVILAAAAFCAAGCGGSSGSNVKCGSGTQQEGNECVVATDPLVGIWNGSRSDNPSYQAQCTFAADYTWGCILLQDGWPSTWSRIEPNVYFFDYSNNEGCDGRTTFSDNNNTMSMVMSGPLFFSGMTLSMTRVQ
jgi:hypothetical protein